MTTTEERIILGRWRCKAHDDNGNACNQTLAMINPAENTLEIKCERCGKVRSFPLSHRV